MRGEHLSTPSFFDKSNAYVQDLLKKNGLLDDMYIYWFDEPTEDDYDYIIEVNDAVKRGGPNLKILLTEQVEEKLKGHVDAWCPVFSRYVKDDLVERQKLGDEAWTYVCCCPKGRRITLFIDHPATELCLWIWHSFKNAVNGILIWETVYWSRSTTRTLFFKIFVSKQSDKTTCFLFVTSLLMCAM